MSMRPNWGREAKKILFDQDITIGDVARELNFSRVYVSSVMSGRLIAPHVAEMICSYLGMSNPASYEQVEDLRKTQ